jgi:hypothetical protein
MKKSKLIEMLNALPGDPDIKLWNGMVGDWMDIDPKLIEQDLVKETLVHWLEMCRLQECRERKDWEYQMPAEKVERLTKNYSNVHSWDINDYVTPEDIKAKRYNVKKVLLMQPKKKGVKTWDRVGSISY